MLTRKIGITVAVLTAAFGVTFGTFGVASVVGPVAPAYAADDEDDGPLDEDDCERLEHLYNDAVKEGSDAHAAGNFEYWGHMQDIAAELYLEAEFGGCEWAAEAAPPASTGSIPDYATQDLAGYTQWLQSDEYRAQSKRLRKAQRRLARRARRAEQLGKKKAAAILADQAELIDLAADFTNRAWAPVP